MSALIVSALAIGAGIWYSSTVGSYDRVTDIDALPVAGELRAIADYQGLDGVSSPLKLRGCFTQDWDVAASDAHRDEATPLVTPGWFDCFDALQIDADIQAGTATVLISEENNPFGFTTYLAVYQDGRGVLWRQINACGEAQFEGSELPQGCPGAKIPEGEIAALSLAGYAEILQTVAGSVRGTGAYACFETPLSQALLSETFVILDTELGAPQGAPACFPESLIADASAGNALALAGAENNQIIAIYPDGRGFVWVVE